MVTMAVEKLTRAEVDRLIDKCQSGRRLSAGIYPQTTEQFVAELLCVGRTRRERGEQNDPSTRACER